MLEGYITTDEVSDVITSLQMMSETLDGSTNDPQQWKWVIIALHSSVQGAMVCHLSGTANLGACNERSAAKWLKWYHDENRDEGNPPELLLADPKTMLKRLSGEKERIEQNLATTVSITAEQQTAFELMCSLRNGFVHFHPMSWSIELAGLPKMAMQILKLVEAIYEDGWSFRHADDSQRTAFTSTISKLKMQLSCLPA